MTEDALRFIVDPERCTHCGSCAADCPIRIIEIEGDLCPFVPADKQDRCLLCQHCLAVCPEAAVSVGGLLPDGSRLIDRKDLPSLDQMDVLVRARRSVRRFRDADVDAALIDRLLDTIAHAPTGVNFRQLTFTVIQDRTVLQSLRENLMQSLANAAAAGRLSETVEKVANTILSARKEGRDVVFRDAPHLLLVSSPPDAPCAEQDVAISLSYFELAAQSAGLGTVWCGYIHRLLEILPECKPMFQIPNGHIYYAMLFGLPAVSYPRTVQRSGSATIRKVRSV